METKAREIRIHGVSGTAPAAVLSRDGDGSPERVASYIDQLTGFYRLRAEEAADLEVEAYSWGALTSGGGRVQERIKRIGWLSLLPFALVNVGYWARPGLERSDRKTPEGRSRKATAIALRWGGLVMTIAFVGTICWVSVDLLAWQCFRGGSQVCALPDTFAGVVDVLGTPPWNTGSRRILIASALPVIALVGLVLLSNQARGRYESVPDRPPGGTRHKPTHLDGCQVILRRDKMWLGNDRVRRQQWLHIAVGLSVVVVYATLPILRAGGTGSRAIQSEVELGTTVLQVAFGFSQAAILAALASAWFSVGDGNDFRGAPDPRSRSLANGMALLAVGSVVLGVVLTVWADGVLLAGFAVDDGKDLFGNDLFIGLVFGALSMIVAFVAFASRSTTAGWLAALSVVGSVLLGWLLGRPSRVWADSVVGASFAALFILVVLVGGTRLQGRLGGARVGQLAWRGAGPAVFLGAGTFVALTFSVVVSVGTADLFNGGAPVTAIDASSLRGYALQRVPGIVVVPNVLLWVATLLPFWILAVALLVAVTRARFGRRMRTFIADFATTEDVAEADLDRCAASRFTASFTHRTENLIGRVAMITVAFMLAVGMGAINGEPPWGRFERLRVFGDVGLYFAILLGGAVMWFASKVRTSNDVRRQAGILWDLATFWPRSAHPFGPPCYAERVVPEVTRRVRQSLAEGRLVILSGHSQGSVIAVAVASRLGDDELRNVRLVTYGSQLRAWFGRFFPGVLGPDALGTAPIGAVWGYRSLLPDAPMGDGPIPPAARNKCAWSLKHRLQGPDGEVRWVNLFRRTDPIGFPVFTDGLAPEADDIRVGELDDRFDLGTHSGYQFTPEYRAVIGSWLAEGERAGSPTAASLESPPTDVPPGPAPSH